MKVEITYPRQSKKKLKLVESRHWTKWPFLLAAYACPIVNIFVGGKAWSIIVLWSLYILWTFIFSPSLVEYNRISQFVKGLAYISILLILIDIFIAPVWIRGTVTLLFFGGLTTTGFLFFTDLERQKQNMMPMLWIIFIAVFGVILSLIFWLKESGWELIVMGSIAIALLIACLLILPRDLIRELKKRFHTK